MWWLWWLGCASECRGPACEDAWPGGELVHVRPNADTRVNLDTLPDRIVGSLQDGSDWTVAVGAGRLAVGLPERGAVVRVEPVEGASALEELTQTTISVVDAAFGASVAFADTDGDGVDELWVGAPEASGRGSVFRIDNEGPTEIVTSSGIGDGLGTSLVRCGDVTGDGRDDLVVTAPSFRVPDDETFPDGQVPNLAGVVFLIRSESLSTVDLRPWMHGPAWWGAGEGHGAGRAVACSEDFSGDGLADVVIGVPFGGVGGRVHIQASQDLASGPVNPFWRLEPDADRAGRFGDAVAATSGRLVVGAPWSNDGEGSVSIYNMDSPLEAPHHVAISGSHHFGRRVAAGELDGEPGWDLWVGSPDHRELDDTNDARSLYDVGRAWRWSDVEASVDAAPDQVWMSVRPFARVGGDTVFGDYDGDGVLEGFQPLRR